MWTYRPWIRLKRLGKTNINLNVHTDKYKQTHALTYVQQYVSGKKDHVQFFRQSDSYIS
jgi:hypothetical protein